jgi:hypothetical protein
MDARRIFAAAGVESHFMGTCNLLIRCLGPGAFLEAGREYFEGRRPAAPPPAVTLPAAVESRRAPPASSASPAASEAAAVDEDDVSGSDGSDSDGPFT